MLRVGLTGGVACGKSSVGRMLADRGAHFLQADTLAHQLYAPGQATYRAIVEHFGGDIVNLDRTINRQRLADIVFPDRIQELNAISTKRSHVTPNAPIFPLKKPVPKSYVAALRNFPMTTKPPTPTS